MSITKELFQSRITVRMNLCYGQHGRMKQRLMEEGRFLSFQSVLFASLYYIQSSYDGEMVFLTITMVFPFLQLLFLYIH